MTSLPAFTGAVELRPGLVPRPEISHVVFDFDGTLSWLRHGWPGIMLGMFEERLPSLPGEPAQSRHDLLQGVILGLNGKPTIMQMIRFAELVSERGGTPPDPESLRKDYQDRLDAEIAARSELIRQGKAMQSDFIVHGARPLLEKLRDDGLTLIILSGTIEHRVKEEAELLGLTPFFGRHIYGSTPDPFQFSKLAVFERLIHEEGITSGHLLSFGDGGVEITSTKQVGGLAVAVCSDEDDNGSGVMDPFKRAQLTAAGADVAIPDFQDGAALVDYLRGR